ncbi:hypothetical protein ACSSS7_001479 [Eimeria intestinalis]
MAAVAVGEGSSRSALRRESTAEAVEDGPQRDGENGKDVKRKGKSIISKKLRFADPVEPEEENKKEENKKAEVKERSQQNEERKSEDASSASSSEKLQNQIPVNPSASRTHRLQLSLRRLVSWQSVGGRSGGAKGGPLPLPTDRGGSPPTFVQKPTVRWPGSRGAQSIAAADLGSTVALWISYYQRSSASLALYHPHDRTIEEDLSLEAEPDAVFGVTFTAGELRPGLGGALLFGGRTADQDVLNDCWFYRTQTGQWTRINFKGNPPSPRCNHAAAYSPKTRNFFFSGGQGTEGEALQGTYQLADGKWKELTVKEEAPARTHHTLSVVLKEGFEEHLLSFGGLVWGSESNDLWSLSLDFNSTGWQPITDAAGVPPSPRRGYVVYVLYTELRKHSAISSGSRMFIFGGIGRHWLGWEVPYFDITLFDSDVNSWFEVVLMSPLVTPRSYGFAVAAGNPKTSIHLFAAGSSSDGDGAVFSVGAVCSTLDICMYAQGIRDAKVVCGDSREKIEGLRDAVRSTMEDSKNREESLHELITTTESLTSKFESLLQRIVEAQADVSAMLQSVQAFAAKMEETTSTTASKEAAAQRKIDEMEAKVHDVERKLRKLERLMTREEETEDKSE